MADSSGPVSAAAPASAAGSRPARSFPPRRGFPRKYPDSSRGAPDYRRKRPALECAAGAGTAFDTSLVGHEPEEERQVLTLDEPDPQTFDRHDPWRGAFAPSGVPPVDHLFMAVRAWCEHPPRVLVSRDPDPLYRAHGDPRD